MNLAIHKPRRGSPELYMDAQRDSAHLERDFDAAEIYQSNDFHPGSILHPHKRGYTTVSLQTPEPGSEALLQSPDLNLLYETMRLLSGRDDLAGIAYRIWVHRNRRRSLDAHITLANVDMLTGHALSFYVHRCDVLTFARFGSVMSWRTATVDPNWKHMVAALHQMYALGDQSGVNKTFIWDTADAILKAKHVPSTLGDPFLLQVYQTWGGELESRMAHRSARLAPKLKGYQSNGQAKLIIQQQLLEAVGAEVKDPLRFDCREARGATTPEAIVSKALSGLGENNESFLPAVGTGWSANRPGTRRLGALARERREATPRELPAAFRAVWEAQGSGAQDSVAGIRAQFAEIAQRHQRVVSKIRVPTATPSTPQHEMNA